MYLKEVQTSGNEATIARMLSSKELRQHPDNHCVPVLDFIQDHNDPALSYLVMPFLRYIDSPPFQQVNDVIDVVDQLLNVRSMINVVYSYKC